MDGIYVVRRWNRLGWRDMIPNYIADGYCLNNLRGFNAAVADGTGL
jgi:hypothetical protein